MAKKMNQFIEVCKVHNQYTLKRQLSDFMKNNGYAVVSGDGYLYCVPNGTSDPICFTAHMDTVHKEAVKRVMIERHQKETIISSPQGIGGDDRCGIFMIMEIVRSGYKPYVVFCEDEEIGCVGASKFARSQYATVIGKECMFMVELDRRNGTDAVYYELDNEEFEQYVTEITGYKTAIGSYSDICEIAPVAGIAAVNLSCGYYQEHTLQHYVVWEEMMNTLRVAKLLCKAATKDRKQFEYKELLIQSRYGSFWDGYKTGYSSSAYGWGNDYGYDEGWSFTLPKKDGTMDVFEEFVTGRSFEECLGQILVLYPELCYSDVIDASQDY